MTVSNMPEKMSEKVPDEISPVEKGSTKKFSDLCDFEGMDQYSNVVELLVEYTLFLENTKMTKNKIDPDDPDGLNAQEQKRRRLLGRTIRLWKQKFKSIEYTVQAVHEFATQHKLLIGVLDGMRDFDFIVSFKLHQFASTYDSCSDNLWRNKIQSSNFFGTIGERFIHSDLSSYTK